MLCNSEKTETLSADSLQCPNKRLPTEQVLNQQTTSSAYLRRPLVEKPQRKIRIGAQIGHCM